MRILLRSFSTPNKFYLVDKDALSCNCSVFAVNKHCKHLETVGCYKMRKAALTSSPSYSQALSALVKCIRLRDINEGAYWLHYCWRLRNSHPGSQLKTVLRLLIGSAEDGHSIAIMEKVAENFLLLLNENSKFELLAAEFLRICKVPNWWQPATGGHDYIHSGMVAWRKSFYDHQKYSLEYCLSKMEQYINRQEQVEALFWMMKSDTSQTGAGVHIANRLLAIAAYQNHIPALCLIRNIYLKYAHFLSDDGNFIGQAVWLLAGGNSPVMDQLELVTNDEVHQLIEQVKDTSPYPPPEWCCDGIHCEGNDLRYAGMWDRMYAMCNQFNKYQRLLPADNWCEDEFYSMDGLQWQDSLIH